MAARVVELVFVVTVVVQPMRVRLLVTMALVMMIVARFVKCN